MFFIWIAMDHSNSARWRRCIDGVSRARSIVTFIKLERWAITETEYLRSSQSCTRKTFYFFLFIVFRHALLCCMSFHCCSIFQTARWFLSVFDSAFFVRENERKTPQLRASEGENESRKTLHMNDGRRFTRMFTFFILHRLMSSIRFIFHSHITHVEMNNNRRENVQLFEIQQLVTRLERDVFSMGKSVLSPSWHGWDWHRIFHTCVNYKSSLSHFTPYTTPVNLSLFS